MSRSSEPSLDGPEAETRSKLTLAEWAESRATLLVAISMLVVLLLVLIVVSLLHPR